MLLRHTVGVQRSKPLLNDHEHRNDPFLLEFVGVLALTLDLALILLGSLPSEHELLETTLPIVEEVETQDFTVEDVVLKDYLFYDDEGITTAYETEYDVQSSEDACIDDDDDDDDEYFLVDEENEIVEPDADVHLFGISMDLPFENIGVTNLIPDDVLEGEEGFQISMSKAFRAKAKAKRDIRGDHVLQYSMLRDYVIELLYTNPNTTAKIAVERNIDPSLPTRMFQRLYVCLGALKLDFKACIRDLLGLDGVSGRGHFQANLIWTIINFLVKPLSSFSLLIEVFNGKIVGDRDKPVITLLEYIREYCMKRILNVQCVIEKYIGPLTPTATKIMESIKKEAHLLKELTRIPCKHEVANCWNMALNDRASPPLEAWVNPCYWLSTWRETYSHKVGRPRKKRKRSKHEDEPFVKDGKLSRKGRTIICQSCENTRHNKATCKGQCRKATTGCNNAEANGSASRQAQQTEPIISQDGLGGSGAGAVIVCLMLLVKVVQVLAVKVHPY
ncbi:hypothetical protein Tco_0760032 [Tanacetum coccineum]